MTRRRWDYIPTEHEREYNDACMGCTVELPINESRVWCPNAADAGFHCQMKKTFRNIQFARPWVEQFNMSAGRVIRSKQQLTEHFKVQSDAMSERMNFDVNLQIADPSDHKATEDGLDSTHDANVASGLKESKGKFVHDFGS